VTLMDGLLLCAELRVGDNSNNNNNSPIYKPTFAKLWWCWLEWDTVASL